MKTHEKVSDTAKWFKYIINVAIHQRDFSLCECFMTS